MYKISFACVFVFRLLARIRYYLLWILLGRYITQKPVRYTAAAGRVGVRSTAGATARGRARPAPCESSKSPQYDVCTRRRPQDRLDI